MAKHDLVHSFIEHDTYRNGGRFKGQRGAHEWFYRDIREYKDAVEPENITNERGRLGGCRCGLCGKTYLWRQSLADYEVLTGCVEDPVTMDKIIVASGDDYDSRYGGNLNLQRRLSDGRSNADLIRCTLCYEARCAHCARVLQFQDFMWADRCRFCDGPMSPQFSRRPWPEQRRS